MITLSQKAYDFLKTQERVTAITDRNEIIKAFDANKLPLFEPLVKFQQDYSGYIFYAGLEPVCFGLLNGGGFPENGANATIDFFHSENQISKYQFVCASTSYQMEFTLDEYGHYYEDGCITASSFDKTVEHLAIWSEIRNNSSLEIVARKQKIPHTDLQKDLRLDIIQEASDEFTVWYKNDTVYLEVCNGLITLIVSNRSDRFDEIKKRFEIN